MIDIDDPMFKYGYQKAISTCIDQIEQLIIEGCTADLQARKTYNKYRATVPVESVYMFEEGWACGSINVRAAVASWLQTPKFSVNYRLPIADIVRVIGLKYKYDMIPIKIENEDEILTAMLVEDITRDVA